MASTYYDSAGKTVVDGDIAYAADLNDVNTAVDTAFQQVETDVDTIAANQPFYSNLAQKWAEEVEDTPVTTGKFSALHWAAKAEDQAILADADRVQTNADRVQTGLDRVQTVADRVQTGLDRTQTGLDVADAEAAAAISVSNAKGRNYIIDGNFDIWLEGGSQTISGYGSDTMSRNENVGTTKVHSRQSFTLGQTLVPGHPKYFSRTVVTSVAGANNICFKQWRIENVSSLSGGKATLSFYGAADATKNIAIEFQQYFGTGGSPSATVNTAIQLVPLTDVMSKKVVTFDIPSITGKQLGTNDNHFLTLNIFFDAGSFTRPDVLGQQSGTFDIAQVQLEKGEVATEFEHQTVGEILSLVSRYYNLRVLNLIGVGSAGGYLGTNIGFPRMRGIPSITLLYTSENVNLTNIAVNNVTDQDCRLYESLVATGNGYFTGGFSFEARL